VSRGEEGRRSLRVLPKRASKVAGGPKWAGERFESEADLVKCCVEKVKLRTKARTQKGSQGFPDSATAKAAIRRHGLDKIAGLRKDNREN
jgi:hypothetical protein